MNAESSTTDVVERSGEPPAHIVASVRLAVEFDDHRNLLALSEVDKKSALDVLWTHLVALRTEKNSHGRNRLRRLVSQISETSGIFPSVLFLKDVKVVEGETDARGTGPLTDIFLGTFGGRAIALKSLRVALQFPGPEAHRDLKQEFYRVALTWRTLSHRFLLPLFGVTDQVFQRMPCMVLPWMENRSILNHISALQKDGKLPRSTFPLRVDEWILQIASGLAYMHSEEVMHGNLRCNNVLIDSEGKVQLTDFGMSKINDVLEVSFATAPNTLVRWQSPEILDPEFFDMPSSQPTCASDVYSFACTCIELYTSKPPFYQRGTGDEYHIITNILDGSRPLRPIEPENVPISDCLWKLMTECWAHDPCSRPSADEIVSKMDEILKAKSKHLGNPRAPTPPPKDVAPLAPQQKSPKVSSLSESPSQRNSSTSILQGSYFWRWFHKTRKR